MLRYVTMILTCLRYVPWMLRYVLWILTCLICDKLSDVFNICAMDADVFRYVTMILTCLRCVPCMLTCLDMLHGF